MKTKKSETAKKPKRLSTMKAIRMKCFDCSGFDAREVGKCTVIDCALWPWRFGMKPEVSDARGKQTNPYELSGAEYANPDIPSSGVDTHKEIDIPLLWELTAEEQRKRMLG